MTDKIKMARQTSPNDLINSESEKIKCPSCGEMTLPNKVTITEGSWRLPNGNVFSNARMAKITYHCCAEEVRHKVLKISF